MINYSNTKHLKSNQSGNVLLFAMVTVGLVLITTLFVIAGAQLYYQTSLASFDKEKVIALAEAGVNKGLAALNESGGTYNGEGETVFGDGSYSVTISSLDANTKVVESTGYLPDKSNPKVKRTVKLTVSKGSGTAFNYGIQVGEGGLEMAKDSTINGSIYSNGNVVMEEDTTITGDVYVAGGTQPTADQSTECEGANCFDFIFGKNVSGNNQLDVTQSFKPGVNNVLNKVSLKLKKFGSPPNVTVRILGDSSNKPNKNQVLATGTLSAGLVTNQYNFVEIPFTTPPSLTANTRYWIMIDTASSSSNYWAWSLDLAQSYTNGSPAWSPNWSASSPVWTNFNGDLGFKIFMGGIATYIQGDSDVQIDGDAHANTLNDLSIGKGAYYQVSQNITAATYHPASTDPAVQAMPISDANITDWKSQAEAAGVYTGNITNCPATILAGKYVGSITLPENCDTVVGSPIWVTGNLTLNKSVTVSLNSSFGSSSGIFMVDNFITLDKDDSLEGSGTSGSYLFLISNFNSRDDPQHRDAISVSKEGNNGVFYSALGSINVAKENDLTSVTGWKLKFDKEMEINYDQGLAGTFFSSGPSGSYSVVKGTYQIK